MLPPFVGSIGLLLIGSVVAFWMKPGEGLDDPAPIAKGPLVPATLPAP